MTNKEMAAQITQNSVFSGFSEEEIAQLESIVSYRHATKHEVIFKIDDTPHHIYYLLDGILHIQFPDNKRFIIEPNHLIGEIGILNGDFRLGKLVAMEDCRMIKISAKGLFDKDMVAPVISLEIIRRLNRRVTDYLRSKQQTSSRVLIQSGEGEHIEFKSTLRWNFKAKKNDTNITQAVLKTITAFLYSEGGTLFVGVEDELY